MYKINCFMFLLGSDSCRLDRVVLYSHLSQENLSFLVQMMSKKLGKYIIGNNKHILLSK